MKMLKIGLFIFYKLMPKLKWSSQAESNRRPFPYHGNALPTELCEPHIIWCQEQDSNLRRLAPTDLQSVPFGRFGILALLT